MRSGGYCRPRRMPEPIPLPEAPKTRKGNHNGRTHPQPREKWTCELLGCRGDHSGGAGVKITGEITSPVQDDSGGKPETAEATIHTLSSLPPPTSSLLSQPATGYRSPLTCWGARSRNCADHLPRGSVTVGGEVFSCRGGRA